MWAITQVYVSSAERWEIPFLSRAVASALLLLPPTILMGATLPAISRWMKLTSIGYSRIGALYSANIVGAVLGTLLAGFYLLRSFDIYVATLVAVGLNLVIAGVGYVLGTRTRFEAAEEPRVAVEGPSEAPLRVVYVAIGLSGLTALGAQVVWTRLLSLLLGVTVYNFAAVLAVFLIGLGAGSAIGARHCRRTKNPLSLLGLYQLGLVFAIPYAAFAITSFVPSLEFLRGAWLATNLDDLLRVAIAILPATVCWRLPACRGGRRRQPSRSRGPSWARLRGEHDRGHRWGPRLQRGIHIFARHAQLAGIAHAVGWAVRRSGSDERFAPLRAAALAGSLIAPRDAPAKTPDDRGRGRRERRHSDAHPRNPGRTDRQWHQVKRWNEPAEYLHVRKARAHRSRCPGPAAVAREVAGTSISTGRSAHPISPTTCDCSACWAIFR